MAISYMKLREILVNENIPLKVLGADAKVNHNTLAKIYKDQHMSTESLEKIARYLNREIGDIISLK